MTAARRTLFAASAAGAGYVLAGYPLLVAALPARTWRRDETATPRVSIIVPAYRERELLAAKLRALADLDYPADALQVVVAVDEDEKTAALAHEAWPAVEVIFSAERRGKSLALSRAMEHVTGDIVLLTDANNVLDPASLRAAVRHFGDPQIWAVAGRRGERGSAYDRYEDLVRRLESRSGVVAAMSGEFMAVRRERLPEIPGDVVNDDFWLLCNLVRGGGRVIYEPEAFSTEGRLEAKAELSRRSRMSAGRVMLASELRGMPAGFVWRAVSHKHGRLALPFFLLGALAGSASLARHPGWRAVAGAQAGVYIGGLLASLGVAPPGPAGKVLSAAGQFTLGNVATAVGVVRALRGRQSVRWEAVR